MSIDKDWSRAQVLEPLGFVDEKLNTVGALVLTSGAPIILSLDPGEDFELNTDIIHQWKIVFQTQDGEVLGDADYQTLIREIRPFILDQQNGSLLVYVPNDEDLSDLYTNTIFD